MTVDSNLICATSLDTCIANRVAEFLYGNAAEVISFLRFTQKRTKETPDVVTKFEGQLVGAFGGPVADTEDDTSTKRSIFFICTDASVLEIQAEAEDNNLSFHYTTHMRITKQTLSDFIDYIDKYGDETTLLSILSWVSAFFAANSQGSNDDATSNTIH